MSGIDWLEIVLRGSRQCFVLLPPVLLPQVSLHPPRTRGLFWDSPLFTTVSPRPTRLLPSSPELFKVTQLQESFDFIHQFDARLRGMSLCLWNLPIPLVARHSRCFSWPLDFINPSVYTPLDILMSYKCDGASAVGSSFSPVEFGSQTFFVH